MLRRRAALRYRARDRGSGGSLAAAARAEDRPGRRARGARDVLRLPRRVGGGHAARRHDALGSGQGAPGRRDAVLGARRPVLRDRDARGGRRAPLGGLSPRRRQARQSVPDLRRAGRRRHGQAGGRDRGRGLPRDAHRLLAGGRFTSVREPGPAVRERSGLASSGPRVLLAARVKGRELAPRDRPLRRREDPLPGRGRFHTLKDAHLDEPRDTAAARLEPPALGRRPREAHRRRRVGRPRRARAHHAAPLGERCAGWRHGQARRGPRPPPPPRHRRSAARRRRRRDARQANGR
mmetsp:Transcript_3179/g.9124  ORF Transcript_3179/g.9124 Transcript_3179/m.9124 type:complete len:293 (-) Transcript_3179:292-1170(-)